MSIQELLAQRIAAEGGNKSAVARKIGTDASHVNQWLWGSQPSTKWCRRIAEAFGLAEDDVLVMAGHKKGEVSLPDDPEKAAAVAEVRRIIERTPPSSLKPLLEAWRAIAALPSLGVTIPRNTQDVNKIYQAV